MSEQDWTFKPAAPVRPTTVEPGAYTGKVDGLAVAVRIESNYLTWSAEGFLGDLPVYSMEMGYRLTQEAVAEAQAKAIASAHRLYAAGVRGEKSSPVSCCDRLLPTREDAERHEREHTADVQAALIGAGGFVGATIPRWTVEPRWAVIDATGLMGRPPIHDDEQAARDRCDHLNADAEAMPTPAELDAFEAAIGAGGEATKGTVIHVTAQVEIEDGQEGRYRVALGPTEDSPWWVVDLGPAIGTAPVSVYSFVDRVDAIDFRDALNAGRTDTAARIRASEDRRREAEASEGGEENQA